MATRGDDHRQHVLQRVQPVVVAALGQAERGQHHHAHAGAEEAAIDGGDELHERPGERAHRWPRGRPSASASATARRRTARWRRAAATAPAARKEGLSSAKQDERAASAPTAEISAEQQRAAPEILDVAPIGERRGDVARKLRDRRGGVGDDRRHADQRHGAEGDEGAAAGDRVDGARQKARHETAGRRRERTSGHRHGQRKQVDRSRRKARRLLRNPDTVSIAMGSSRAKKTSPKGVTKRLK